MTRSRYEEEFEEVEKLGKGKFNVSMLALASANVYSVHGTGGYGSVFRVRNKLDGEEYAIKKVRLRSLDMSDKIFREVKTLARLDHPHVVRYYAAWLEYHNQVHSLFYFTLISMRCSAGTYFCASFYVLLFSASFFFLLFLSLYTKICFHLDFAVAIGSRVLTAGHPRAVR